jgi:hypothetical protein
LLHSLKGWSLRENRGDSEAVEHGKAGHSVVLVEHAETALEHANKAVGAAKNSDVKHHMHEAVTALKEGIEHGKLEHADKATHFIEDAIKHIEAGNK